MGFWEIFLICLIVFFAISAIICCCKLATTPRIDYVQERDNNNHVYVTRRRRFFYQNKPDANVIHQTPPIFAVTQPDTQFINGQQVVVQPQIGGQHQYIELPPTYEEVIIQRPIRSDVQHY